MVPQYGGMTRERIAQDRRDCAGPVRMRSIPERISCIRRDSPPRAERPISPPWRTGPPPKRPARNIPILLSTGRIVVHYNSGSMTRRSPSLQERDFELYVEINPEDAAELKVRHGGYGQGEDGSGRDRGPGSCD